MRSHKHCYDYLLAILIVLDTAVSVFYMILWSKVCQATPEYITQSFSCSDVPAPAITNEASQDGVILGKFFAKKPIITSCSLA